MSLEHIDVPPGRAAQSLWCDRNWHDADCCAGAEAALQRLRASRPSRRYVKAPAHDRGDHSACNRNCEHTL